MMPKINVLTRMCSREILFCCLSLFLCLLSTVSTQNVTQNASSSISPSIRGSREMYDEYEGSDRELLYDPYKTYAGDENLEKGIRKLDSSLESIEKTDDGRGKVTNVTDVASAPVSSTVVAPNSEIVPSAEDDDEQVVVFEDSEAGDSKSNISGTLVTQLIPEILKYNGRMMVPSSSEEQHDDKVRHNQRRETKQDVVQKLPPRRVRAESITTPTTSSAIYARNVSRLEEIFDLYNPYRLLDIWEISEELEKMTVKCREQTKQYFLALRSGKSWAIKMWDASGHYSGGYFWGNQYWMGSRTLCREIASQEYALPFPVEFSIAKANITIKLPTILQPGHSQFIGICLPYACNKDDVHIMVEQSMVSSEAEDDREAEVIKIKSHYDHYYMTGDRTFWLLIISSVLAISLCFVGTVLDLSLEKQKRYRREGVRKNYKYDNYTYAVNPPLQPYSDAIKVEDGCSTEGRSSSSGAETPTSENDDKCVTGLWREIFLSFSVVRNLKQICDSTIGADTIPIIHGLRSISMGWVILGHTCIVAFKYSDNMDFRKLVEKKLLFQTINNTAFTVDTFFFISGLLVSFLYFRTMAKVNVNKITKTTGFLSNCIEFVGLLGYRFCRLTVPYIFGLGLVELSMKWFYYNSVFDPPADDHINCPNYWWRNLLYVNTLFPVKDMCMLWSWYLADDTQFYILGIVLLIVAVRHFKTAAISVCVLMVTSWCVTGYIAYLNNHMPNIDDPLALFDKIYDKPWTRFGPYLVGMIVGWILYKTDCKIAMKKPILIVGWSLCTMAMLSLVYGLYRTELHSITAAAYSSLSHTAWAVALSWIVIACTTGHGGYVNELLSSKLLIPFSRTTYCAYLIHPLVIRWVVMRRDSPVHLGEETVAVLFLGQLVASYILAFILSLTFEAPIVSLLKLISPTKRNKLQ